MPCSKSAQKPLDTFFKTSHTLKKFPKCLNGDCVLEGALRATLYAPRSTRRVLRAALYAPRSTRLALRAALYAPRSTRHALRRALRAALDAPRSTRRALRAALDAPALRAALYAPRSTRRALCVLLHAPQSMCLPPTAFLRVCSHGVFLSMQHWSISQISINASKKWPIFVRLVPYLFFYDDSAL